MAAHMGRITSWITIAAAAGSITAGAGAQTEVTELVIYAIDSGPPYMFVRYQFSTDTYVEIGEVLDQDGRPVDHPECLSYYPAGDAKGFYCVSSGKDGVGPPHRLARINGLNGSAYLFPAPLAYTGFRGMAIVHEPLSANEWAMYAYAHGPGSRRIVKIDPATSVATPVMVVNQVYEGLATGRTPHTLFGVTKDRLYVIDYMNFTETLVGNHGHPRPEALEYAYGDGMPAINIPGVDPAWTANGVLFSFAQGHGLMVMNPTNASVFLYPSSFGLVDCEGLAFFTQRSDPYGNVVVNPHD